MNLKGSSYTISLAASGNHTFNINVAGSIIVTELIFCIAEYNMAASFQLPYLYLSWNDNQSEQIQLANTRLLYFANNTIQPVKLKLSDTNLAINIVNPDTVNSFDCFLTLFGE